MLAALFLVLLAGGMNGSFAAPMKHVRGWEWEHTWLAWSLLAMVVLPWAVAAMTVPHLGAIYRAAGSEPLVRTAVYGMVWGASAVLFGQGITRVGLALGFAIILGTSSALGAIVPLVKLHRERVFTTAGLLTIMAVSIILAGVGACARAGLLREAARSRLSSEGSFAIGLSICLLSGMGAMFMSLALNEATPIFEAAETTGVPSARSLNAVWPVLLAGGFAVNTAYCAFLVVHRGSIARFRETAFANFGLVLAMALLWSGSNFVYGAGARGLGPLGLVLGWPVFMAAIVLTSNAWGVIAGEWRDAGQHAVLWAGAGSLLLILGIALVASAGSVL